MDVDKSMPDITDLSDLTPFSQGTNEAIETLLAQLQERVTATPIKTCTQQDEKNYLLRDSQLPTTLPCKKLVLHESSLPHAQWIKKSLKHITSLFLKNFSSSEKGKEKMTYGLRQRLPFHGHGICYDSPLDLFNDFDNWIEKGLYARHDRKSDNKFYRKGFRSLGVARFEFTVASPTDKN